MRITNKMMSGNSLANINTNKEYLDKLNNQMATEKKITRPSDDPIVAIRALRLRSNLSEISQYYGANVPDAQAWVEVTQSAINSTKDMLSSLKSYADQGANGTNTASDRQKIYENMQAIQKQIYSNGNATNAGRSVFTGYRTGESLTFKEDTTADYRGIWDTFNASDVTKNTYVEGAPTLDEINTLGKVVSSATVRNDKLTVDGHTYDLTKNSAGGYKLLTVGSNTYSVIVTEEATATTPASYEVRVIDNEIEVKEDKVNRIRLSYDNINGSVRKGGTEGWDGKELDEEISGWGSTKTYDYYFNEDGTLTPDGKDWYGIISVNGKDVVVEFNEPYDQTFVVVSPEDKYTREDIRSDVGIRDTDDGIKITVDNTTYTITGGGTEAYSVDKGASVKADGSGNLTLTIPGPEGTQDIYTEIKIDAGGSITSAEKCKKIGEINYWLVKPEYSGESFISNASVSGTPDEIKVNVDDTTYTITRDETGAYSVNHGAAVEDDGSGNLKLKIETDDTYTEIGINGASPSLASVEKYNASVSGTPDEIKVKADDITYTITKNDEGAYIVDSANASVKDDGSGNLTLMIEMSDSYTEIKVDADGESPSLTGAEKYSKKGLSGVNVSGTPDEIKVRADGITYTIRKDDETGAYIVNHGASVVDNGGGSLTLKIETSDRYSEINVDAGGASPLFTGAEKYTKKGISGVNVIGTPDEIKVNLDGTVYTITKDGAGAYSVNHGASVEDDGSGNLKLKIGTSDGYTEIKVDADGESPSLTGAEKYTRQSVAGVSWTPDEKIKVNVDGAAYTITKDASGDYNVDPGASLEDDGSGELTLTIPGPDDTYTKVKINVASQSFNATKYSRQSDASVSGTADEVKIRVGDITYTITKDASGDYIVDPADASVKDDGSGKLKLVIPGTDGSMDSHKEITFDVNGAIPSLIGAEDCTRISDRSDYAGGEDNGGIDLRGRAFGNVASENTTLVYRTELTGKASITPSSVTTDPVDGLQSFELKYGGTTYKIQKFKGEDRWFAVNSSGQALRNIEVVQNSDKSFKITEDTSPASSTTKTTSNVFNVSANGRAVTSYYCEHYLDVQITDSNSPVAVESGKELTAYQYLALGADDKNSDAAAANQIYLLADTGELVFGSNVAETLSSLKDIPGVDTISVMYDKSRYEAGELRPEHYFDVKQYDEKHNMAKPIVYDNHNQDINYTVGTNQSIKINTNAEDVFDTQIIREIDDVLAAIDEYNLEEEKVNKLKAMQEDTGSYDETQRQQIQKMLDAANKGLDIAKNKLQRTYEEAITQFGKFFDQANLADTACGTVDNRLTLVSNRLSEEKTTVTTLASENENVDITNIAVEVSEANLVYNAALMATGRISQQTLVDYI